MVKVALYTIIHVKKKSTASIVDYNKKNPQRDSTTDGYDNYESSGDVVCGKGWTFNRSIANVTYFMVLLFQIIAPVMLVILGMIDLVKGITSGKEDDMKKGQATFFKRLIIALLLFFVITIVRMIVLIALLMVLKVANKVFNLGGFYG